HLLFLLGLLVLVRRPRRVFLTATAFTLSHSVTLAATALHLVSISSQAAEAAIAFSLVLLAADLGRSEKPMHATGMALVFGLVHGFGFAGALAEIGLPDGAVPLALGSFNVGVELGQLAFLCAASLLAALAAHFRLQRPLTHAAALGIGGVGSFWLLERTAVWWL
ncbi:MAG TPA: HupE/UreJ family protein, partial [Myxococcota bacterium]|nr:HupE/UreJ family protein [Myxococcota bacterium]